MFLRSFTRRPPFFFGVNCRKLWFFLNSPTKCLCTHSLGLPEMSLNLYGEIELGWYGLLKLRNHKDITASPRRFDPVPRRTVHSP